MPNVTVVRRLTFNAAHRVHNPELSDLENARLFGKCNNPNWHGHNYILEVSVRGEVEQKTGYVLDLARLKEIVGREVIDKVDHRNLNLDVDFMRGIIPTTENLAVGIWKIVVQAIAPAQLVLIRLWESENNRVEYAGE
ncbi:MAG TPA: 6-carboxytetrahydropterin synthase [Gemmatimonadaceae bacterium]|jgi:6-pyruvoyltetrahydropterin/6-carboxytetrahydropterin synthase|nr:6-carboxytetrahydropterin synthase [Gemmatimonadaceae bacterium]